MKFSRIFVLVGFGTLFTIIYGLTLYGGVGLERFELWSLILGCILLLWPIHNFIQARFRKDFDIFSPYSFFVLLFALFYGVSLIYSVLGKGQVATDFVDDKLQYPLAGALALMGYAMFLIGYRMKFFHQIGVGWRWPRWQGSERSMATMFLIFEIGGWVSRYLNFRQGFYFQTGGGKSVSFLYVSIVGAFIPFTYAGTILALVKHFRRREGQSVKSREFWRSAAYLSVLAELGYGLPTGSKTLLIMPFVLWLFAYNYGVRRLSFKKGIIIGACFLLGTLSLMPLNMIYREITSSKHSSGDLEMSNIIEFLEEAVYEYQDRDPAERRQFGEEMIVKRSSYVSILARILAWREYGGEYYKGETYLLGLVALIPRIMWPGKPEITLGQKFNWQLGYGFEHQQSSLAITILGELFMNFATPGIILGMLIYGLLFRQVYKVLSGGFNLENGLAIPAYSLFWYHGIVEGTGCNFAGILGGLCKTFLIFLVVAHFCGFRYRGGESNGNSPTKGHFPGETQSAMNVRLGC
jgi:hypothetical protein